MTMFELIKLLSKKRGKNLKQVALELGLGENYFYTLKKQSPKSDTLKQIADYFDVSTDYLLGREKQDDDMAAQIMFRMNTDDLSPDEVEELKTELENFARFRRSEIERERKLGK